MQGLRAFCGILKSYKGKYFEKTQLHRLTAKVGLTCNFAELIDTSLVYCYRCLTGWQADFSIACASSALYDFRVGNDT
jgi:hypothetical protein